LYCSDCTDGELARITAKGDILLPYLRSALLEGAPQLDDSLAARRAVDAVSRMIRYRARRNETMSAAESTAAVTRQHDAFLVTYRLRAAQALKTIDPLRAATDVRALCNNPPGELLRQPVYRASFKAIVSCP
jgi:hypothetical protein